MTAMLSMVTTILQAAMATPAATTPAAGTTASTATPAVVTAFADLLETPAAASAAVNAPTPDASDAGPGLPPDSGAILDTSPSTPPSDDDRDDTTVDSATQPGLSVPTALPSPLLPPASPLLPPPASLLLPTVATASTIASSTPAGTTAVAPVTAGPNAQPTLATTAVPTAGIETAGIETAGIETAGIETPATRLARPHEANAPAAAAPAPTPTAVQPAALLASSASLAAPAPVATPAPATSAAPVVVPDTPQPALSAALGRLRHGPDGAHQVEIALHPADLGSVQVKVTITHGTLDVTVACADPAARDAVTAALPSLHRELAGLQRVDIASTATDPRPGADQQPQRDARDTPDQQSRHPRRQPAAPDDEFDRWM